MATPISSPNTPINSVSLQPARRIGRIAAICLGALVLASCGWWSGETKKETARRGCPNAGILADAQMMTEYRPGGGRDITDVAYRWELLDAVAQCTYDDNEVDVDYALSMSVSAGPAATKRSVSVPIFVAVTRMGETVLQKTTFEADVTFEQGKRTAVYTRTFKGLTFEVGEDDGRIYDLVLGFQLTPEQVEDNRARARQ